MQDALDWPGTARERSRNAERKPWLSGFIADLVRPRGSPSLDGLRAVACLIVVILHSVAIPVAQSELLLRGVPKIGVWLFFSLSAFLLTVGFLKTSVTPGSVGRYAWRRVIKIFPPFVLALLLYWVTSTGNIDSFRTALDVLFLQRGPAHFWTIPVEVKVYVALPVVAAALLLCGRNLGPRVTLAVGLLFLVASTLVFPPALTPGSSIEPQWYIATFGAGALAGWAAVKLQFTFRLVDFWIPVIGVVVFAVAVKMGLGGDPANGLLDKHYIFGALWSLAILVAYSEAPRMLSSAPLVLIGRASYSIYLIHWAIIELLKAALPAVVVVPLAIVLSVIGGILAYAVIERPLERMRGPGFLSAYRPVRASS